MIWLGAFVGLVVLLMVWALVIAPGRTRKLFARLEAQGWEKVASDDEALRSALEALWPFDPTVIADDGRHPEITVVSALARSGPEGNRYLVQVRANTRDAFNDNVTSFNTLVLEPRRLTFPEPSVYVLARDRETRVKRAIEILGLRRVESGLDPGFAGVFLTLQAPGSAVRLPGPLQQALLESADLFVYGAVERGRHLPNLCLGLSSSGWAVLVPEPVVMERQMRSFLETADRVSRGLTGS